MYWKICKTDGNPKEKGEYEVILIYPNSGIVVNGKMEPAPGAVFYAESDIRFFGPRPSGTAYSYAMCDQDENAENYWQVQGGSKACETVYAWLDRSDLEIPDLPKGVVWRGISLYNLKRRKNMV